MASSAKKSKIELVLDLSPKYKYNNPSKNFLSEPMLNYILKNASQEIYYKLVQVSKYFLVNQPPQIKTFEKILYAGDLDPYDPDPYKISEIAGNRLWINTTHFTWCFSSVSLNELLQRCFRIDTTRLTLDELRLTYDELKLLMKCGKITSLDFENCIIKHSNGKEVALEDILKMAPFLKELRYYSYELFTLNSQKVAGLPKFYHLNSIDLSGFAEDFSCKSFRNFLKKVSNVTSGRFGFYYDVSPKYLRDVQIAALKEVDPNIKVNCVEQTIYFGDFGFE